MPTTLRISNFLPRLLLLPPLLLLPLVPLLLPVLLLPPPLPFLPPPRLAGLDHLALVAHDMKRTKEFLCQVLGMRLSKTITLPNDQGQHFFFDWRGGTTGEEGDAGGQLAYFWFPDAPPAAPGVSVIDKKRFFTSGKYVTSIGSMNHVAIRVRQEDDLKIFQQRLRASPLCKFTSPIVYHADTVSGFREEDTKDEVRGETREMRGES